MTSLRCLWKWERTANYGRVWFRNASNYTKEKLAEEAHASKTLTLWKRISLFVAVPGVLYVAWRSFVSDVEHIEHKDYRPWSHLRIRNKPFPWGDGDKSLFHNPHTNPCPDSDIVKDETVDTSATKSQFISTIHSLWHKYLFEDRVKRDEERFIHLSKMQKRYEDYQVKKKMPSHPIQPLRNNFQKNWEKTPVNAIESIQNMT